MVSLPAAITSGFKNYVNFRDRSTRAAYWWWVLFAFVVGIIVSSIDRSLNPNHDGTGYLYLIWVLVTLLPNLAVTVRRLRDANFSPYLVLLWLVPFVGWIAILVLTIMPSRDGQHNLASSYTAL